MSNHFLSKRYDRDDKSNSAMAEKHWHGLKTRASQIERADFFKALAVLLERICEDRGNRHVFQMVAPMFEELDPDILDEYVGSFHRNLDSYDEHDTGFMSPPETVKDLRPRIGQVVRNNFFAELAKLLEKIVEEESKKVAFNMIAALFEAMGAKRAQRELFRLHRILDKYDPSAPKKKGRGKRRKKNKQPKLKVVGSN